MCDLMAEVFILYFMWVEQPRARWHDSHTHTQNPLMDKWFIAYMPGPLVFRRPS